MDRTVLSIEDLTVESFTTATEMSVIGGEYETGCIGPCQNQFTGGLC